MSPENINPTQPTRSAQPAPATPAPVTPPPAAPAPQAAPASTPAPAPQVPEPAVPAPAPAPAAPVAQTPTPAAPQTPASSAGCKCPTINPADWDKKKTQINKTFFKAYSPRLLYYPFSFDIDVYRAVKGATAKGYKPVEKGMVLDTGGMFWANVMVEVTGANTQDPEVVSLEGKEVYTKVCRSEWKDIKNDIAELEKELGRKPAQLYIWWTSCPKCTAGKEVKAVLIAV